MTLEIVSRSNPVPNASGCWVLCQTLVKRGKFRCHLGKGQERSAEPKKAGMEEGPGGNNTAQKEVGDTHGAALGD